MFQDMDSATNFCKEFPLRCDTTNPQVRFDPRTVGNLQPAPYLDYAMVIIWGFGGAVIRRRGEMIVEAIADAARNVALINKEAPEAQIDSVSLQVNQ